MFITHFSRWSVESENSRFAAVAGIGGTFGTILIMPLCGMLIEKFGWEVSVRLYTMASMIE